MIELHVQHTAEGVVKVVVSPDVVLANDSLLSINMRDRIKKAVGSSGESKRIVIDCGDNCSAVTIFSARPKELKRNVEEALDELRIILSGRPCALTSRIVRMIAS